MIRLIIIIALLLVSLLAICKAFEYYIWMLAVLIAEYSWVFVLFTLAALLSGFYTHKYQSAGTVLGVIALLLFASPMIRASIVSASLSQRITTALGPAASNNKANSVPFSFWRQFVRNKKVARKQIAYVSYPGVTLTLDYYPAQVPGNRPCIIVIHGGSWNKGDNKQLPQLNSHLALMGYNVAAINYRLAPAYHTPAPVDDVNAAFAWLRKNAADLYIDTNKFVLLGRSAGAQIALLAAYTLHEQGLKGVIDYYGPADMVWGYAVPSSKLIMDSRKVMADYVGGTYQQVPQKFAASSPLEFVNGQSVPTLIIHGDNDVLVSPEHSTRLDEKLKKNGIKHFLLRLPWATHGFDYNMNGPGGQLATYAVDRFLNEVTGN